jgi:hypothetical protein
MICAPCAAGADLTTDPAPQFEAVRTLAAEQHAQCRGGTWCACQHRVASVEVLAERRARPGRLPGLARVVACLT